MDSSDEVIKLTQRLVERDSSKGDVEKVLEKAESHIQRTVPRDCYDFYEFEPNDETFYNLVVGDISSTDLLIVAHVDTVGFNEADWDQDPLGGKIEGNKLYGRGAVDAKSTTAAAIVAVKEAWGDWSRGDPKPPVTLLLECDEELEFRGTKQFIERRKEGRSEFDPELVVICEPTSLDLETTQMGLFHTETVVRGRSEKIHPSRAQVVEDGQVVQKGPHAIQEAISVLKEMDAFQQDLMERDPHPDQGPITFTISLIEGGTDINSIPRKCRIVTDARVPRNYESKALADELVGRIEEHLDEDDVCEKQSVFEPISTDMSDPAVQKFKRAVESTGHDPEFRRTEYFTEMAHYWEAFEVPGVIFGAGPRKQAHERDEYVEIDTIKKVEASFREAIKAFE